MPLTPPSRQPNPQCCLPSLNSCSALKRRLQCFPPSLPSPLLTLPHPCFLQSLCFPGTLKIFLQRWPQPSLPLTILTLPY
ncbi:hypothetical protein O181_045977 [Austropuccinia psidii MF-1]|uniref:Uncharacterized protein n=1 Tax=Austropuccinia psidii MF-1 TaxID=1389203 RepID=A0A9Q3HJ90_9BASI|nr:hypothetical protein [Austropuccinia psidii MF-1]